MSTIKRSWDLLTEEERKVAINALIAHFSMERDETIGIIAAGNMLDAMLQASSTAIYNKGVDDAMRLIANKQLDTAAELELLRKT